MSSTDVIEAVDDEDTKVTPRDKQILQPAALPIPAGEFSAAIAENDKARRKAGWVLGIASFVIVIAAILVVIVKMSALLGAEHTLTAKFLEAENQEFRSEILLYLGIIILGQSIVSIYLIVWSGKMINVATELFVPIREMKKKDSVEEFSKQLQLVEPFIKAIGKTKD